MQEMKQITVAEFFNHPSSGAILEGYAQECAIVGMPVPNPDVSLYEIMEKAGIITILGVFEGDDMVGFLVFLMSRSPHYSATIGTIESIYVDTEKRKGGAGITLINKAKQMAKDGGAAGMFISAPASGVFTKVMEGMGARNTNNVFFWSFRE